MRRPRRSMGMHMPTELNAVPASVVLTPMPAPEPDAAALPASVVCRVVADAPHAYPCRRCLRDAEPGDALVLLPYDPFLGESPYCQPGPIYLHESSCAYEPQDALPDQLARRLLSVRAFDAAHFQAQTCVVEGSKLLDVAAELFTDPRVAYLHVHNAGPGCFAVRMDRPAR
jgi:hypothetical protein